MNVDKVDDWEADDYTFLTSLRFRTHREAADFLRTKRDGSRVPDSVKAAIAEYFDSQVDNCLDIDEDGD